jgi:hypothetical protein
MLDPGGEVVPFLAPLHGAADHAGVADVAAKDAQRSSLRHPEAARVADDHMDPPPLGEEEGEQPLADESGDSGEEDGRVAHGRRV